jgi:hypothetical protein
MVSPGSIQSPRSAQTSYFRSRDNSTDQSISTPATPGRALEDHPSLHIDTTTDVEKVNPVFVQSPESTTPQPGPFLRENGSWNDFITWLTFAYEKRIDVSPVDRLYQTPWLSHSIILGEFLYSTLVGFFIPLVMLAVVGGWTHFATSTYGVSFIFNLIALFGLPLIQFSLYLKHLVVRVQREFKSRREYGTFYSEGKARRRKTWEERKRDAWWRTVVAQSVGIYFPTSRWVVLGYAMIIIGVSVSEFVFVGINLQRTLSCQPLI